MTPFSFGPCSFTSIYRCATFFSLWSLQQDVGHPRTPNEQLSFPGTNGERLWCHGISALGRNSRYPFHSPGKPYHIGDIDQIQLVRTLLGSFPRVTILPRYWEFDDNLPSQPGGFGGGGGAHGCSSAQFAGKMGCQWPFPETPHCVCSFAAFASAGRPQHTLFSFFLCLQTFGLGRHLMWVKRWPFFFMFYSPIATLGGLFLPFSTNHYDHHITPTKQP